MTEAKKEGKIFPPESSSQRAYMQWCQAMAKLDERFSLIKANRDQGGMNMAKWGAIRKLEGGAKGFPDIEVLVPVGKYHGLFVEMKREAQFKISSEQKDWGRLLTKYGYAFVFAFGVDEAMELTKLYFKNELGISALEKTMRILEK